MTTIRHSIGLERGYLRCAGCRVGTGKIGFHRGIDSCPAYGLTDADHAAGLDITVRGTVLRPVPYRAWEESVGGTISVALTSAAQQNVDETGIDPMIDVEAIRSGGHTASSLLAHCLDGADEDRVQGWREYVSAVVDAATYASGPHTIADDIGADKMYARTATAIIGRDGMGACGYTEADFEAYLAYVTNRIDELTGLDVTVESSRARDGQDTVIRAGSAEDCQTIRDALDSLWESFCEDTALWPSLVEA